MKIKSLVMTVLLSAVAFSFSGCNQITDVQDAIEDNAYKPIEYYAELKDFPTPDNFVLYNTLSEDHHYVYALSTDERDSLVGVDAYISCLRSKGFQVRDGENQYTVKKEGQKYADISCSNNGEIYELDIAIDKSAADPGDMFTELSGLHTPEYWELATFMERTMDGIYCYDINNDIEKFSVYPYFMYVDGYMCKVDDSTERMFCTLYRVDDSLMKPLGILTFGTRSDKDFALFSFWTDD